MDQLQELLSMLSKTPEMALWGAGLYFLFILIKMASWVGALTLLIKLFIKKHFEYKHKSIEASKAQEILEFFEGRSINKCSSDLVVLLDAMRTNGLGYIHQSDIKEAIEIIKEHKK